jgi:hypothetical protein
MEEQFEDHRNFGPSSLESRNEASVLMIIKAERRKLMYIKKLIQISKIIYHLLIIM